MIVATVSFIWFLLSLNEGNTVEITVLQKESGQFGESNDTALSG